MKVKVHNRNTYDYAEEYQGEMIKIKAGGFHEMEETDAVQFLGQFSSIKRDADGAPHPSSFKRLVIDEDDLKKCRADREAKAKPAPTVVHVEQASNQQKR
jgi:hypothetical protein